MKKIVFIVLDGLADEPIPALGGKTPLEAAQTPNLDLLAQEGICGSAKVESQGALPTSESGHFSLFGYDPVSHKIRRGILTAKGAGLKTQKGDVALRGNLATIGKNRGIIDRRAGRIKDGQALINSLKGIKIDGAKFLIKSATEHRLAIIIRGRGLSPNVSDNDPHYGKLGQRARKIKPLDRTRETKETAKILNQFLEESHQILKNHPLNKRRKAKGLAVANYLLLRGASSVAKLPSFKNRYGLKACCIAGKFLYQQIGRVLAMDLIKVKGATGKSDTNLKGKFEAAKKALKTYDFVFLHIKATDSLAEDGNFWGKKEFIEKFDQHLKPLIGLENTLITVTCDHATCSLLKRHCKNPCPVLIYGSEKDGVVEFSEKACQKGSLGKVRQIQLMDKILGLASK